MRPNALILPVFGAVVALALGGCPRGSPANSTAVGGVSKDANPGAVSQIDPLRFDLPKQLSGAK